MWSRRERILPVVYETGKEDEALKTQISTFTLGIISGFQHSCAEHKQNKHFLEVTWI